MTGLEEEVSHLHPLLALQNPLNVLLLLLTQATTSLGLRSSSHVWWHRSAALLAGQEVAVVQPGGLGAGRDLKGAFLPGEVPSATMALPQTCSATNLS